MAAALRSREIRVLLLLQVCASGSFHVYDATAQLYLQQALGYTSEQRGYLLAFAGWMFAVQTYAVVPRLVRRWEGASATPLLRMAFAYAPRARTSNGHLAHAPRACTCTFRW